MSEAERNAAGSDIALLVGRILLTIIFLHGGYSHITNLGGFSAYLGNHGVPLSYPVAVVAACVEFFGSLAVLLGLATRYVAPLVGLFTAIAAFVGHPYWSVPAAEQFNQFNHFFKDVAIVGAFLILYAAGPGRWSIDRRGQ